MRKAADGKWGYKMNYIAPKKVQKQSKSACLYELIWLWKRDLTGKLKCPTDVGEEKRENY